MNCFSFPVSHYGAPGISVISVSLVPPSARSASLRAALAVMEAAAWPYAETLINHRPAAAKISASWTYPRALPRAEPYGVRRRAGWENGRHKRALRPRGTTETLAAPISCGRGSACRKRAILCAKCAKLPFCAPERSAEGNRKASAQHKASGVSQRLTALPAASAALRVKILFAIIGTFITRPVKE